MLASDECRSSGFTSRFECMKIKLLVNVNVCCIFQVPDYFILPIQFFAHVFLLVAIVKSCFYQRSTSTEDHVLLQVQCLLQEIGNAQHRVRKLTKKSQEKQKSSHDGTILSFLGTLLYLCEN